MPKDNATLTTVGYGDVYPITLGGKIFSSIIILIGIGIIAIPTGLIASSINQNIKSQQNTMQFKSNVNLIMASLFQQIRSCVTSELRDSLKQVIDGELISLSERLEELEPKERVKLLIKLLPYIMPKVQTVSHSQDEPLQWTKF